MISIQSNFIFYLLCFTVKVNSDNAIAVHSNDNKNLPAALSEKHLDREHVNFNINNTKDSGNLTKPVSFNSTKPVHEAIGISDLDVLPQPDDGKPSVAKKGVNFTETESHSKNSTDHAVQINITENGIDNNLKKIFNLTSTNSTTVIHKKPLVTESDSDYIDISNQSASDKKTSKENILTLEQIDPLIAKTKPKHSDYVVPIVAVILSVPLVAIAISLVYKRYADWWQHRNYKRMDFLIEGMYHN